MTEEELKEFRKELAHRRSAIDSKLDSMSYSRKEDSEIIKELEEKYDLYEKQIIKIDALLNKKIR